MSITSLPYCKTKATLEGCLKLLTKDCHPTVCRDFNRYEVSKCEIDGTCVFNRGHTCLFCNELNCKAYLHINIQDAGSPNLPKKSASIIKTLTNVLRSCVESIKDLEGRLLNLKTSLHSTSTPIQRQTLNSSMEKTAAGIEHPSVFSTATERRKDFPSNSHSTHLHPSGSMIVPLTFENNRTFRFKMLVIPHQCEKIIFGRNHIMKTEADINVPKRCITFRDQSMNFTLNFELRYHTQKDPT
eukprot:Seg5285.2 transcript_id=Seg5285.2/GoldUCD/mRNA.D3Y31 product="hypothetical protein" protein_id=Seg5285.2/GoldUCD/D3Y31